MSDPLDMGVKTIRVDSHILQTVEHSPLQRIFAFLNLSVDDVIDSPIARTAVHFHWRVHNLVQRRCAAIDAEHIKARLIAGEPMPLDDFEDAMRRSVKHLID
jgi:hypothetical protein